MKSLGQVDENMIYRTLDRGVQGVIVPHVNSKVCFSTVFPGQSVFSCLCFISVFS